MDLEHYQMEFKIANAVLECPYFARIVGAFSNCNCAIISYEDSGTDLIDLMKKTTLCLVQKLDVTHDIACALQFVLLGKKSEYSPSHIYSTVLPE